MRLTLATLPLHAVDLDGRLTLRHGSDDAPGTRVAVLGLGADALLAAAPHLGATLTLTLCDGAPTPVLDAATHSRVFRDGVRASLAVCEDVVRSRAASGLATEGATACAHDVGALLATRPEGDAPPPVPSRDELAARLAKCERELADVTREHSALTDRYGAVVLRLAERDREAAQRAAGVVAGVAADVVDAVAARLGRALRGAPHELAGEVVRVERTLRDLAVAARQRAGGGEGRGERVEGGQEGAADVGGVAERVVVAEGVASVASVASVDTLGSTALIDGVPTYETAAGIRRVVRQHEGQRVRVEVLRGEDGSVHGESVSPTVATREAHS